ncbi:MAG: amino acid adenylation domain-containing protein [Chitinispirillaceae bacterium]|nr:amino acid adenylation domain-containing protein [Chitinispirillaceae bacterium]
MNNTTRTGSHIHQSWNDTSVPYPLTKTLSQLFEEQVEKSPEHIALIFNELRISYAELNRSANQLADFLILKGIGKESIVGVCLERSAEMIIALLAILKAGGAYLPIDPDYPDERCHFIVGDANLNLVITQQAFSKKFPSQEILVFYHRNDQAFSSLSGDNPKTVAAPDSAAYVIYTSGSTGTPKGAVNIHSGIINRLLWMQDCYHLTSQDRILQKTPYTFDVSVWEFFWPLICGAQLVIAEPGGHRDPDYLIAAINKYSITTIHFVPSMLRLFLDAYTLTDIPSLKRVICSGEALPYALQERFFDRLRCQLFNLYGPTEASVDVTWWECRRNDPRKIVPIGKPVANTQIYIVDEQLELVPPGTPGELLIGGVQVARGYLNRQELTKTKFIPDMFTGKDGAQLYKTGDLCRYLDDGAIEYLGRIDDQIKVHGLRIEPAEIEAAILEFKAIRAVSVTAVHDTATDDTKIIAYIVTDLDSIPVNELRNHLLVKLPEYMTPALFVKIETIPLSNNGKVDKKALPPPPSTRPQLLQEYIRPSTETEHSVAKIWSTHLKIEPVGIDDNFFELGGNSILATLVADALEAFFHKSIQGTLLFQHPTIRKLSQHITTHEDESSKKIIETQSRILKQKNILRNKNWLNKSG